MSETTTYPDDLPEPLQVIEVPPLEEPVIMSRACPLDCPGTKPNLESMLDEIEALKGLDILFSKSGLGWLCGVDINGNGNNRYTAIKPTRTEAVQSVLDKIREVESE